MYEVTALFCAVTAVVSTCPGQVGYWTFYVDQHSIDVQRQSIQKFRLFYPLFRRVLLLSMLTALPSYYCYWRSPHCIYTELSLWNGRTSVGMSVPLSDSRSGVRQFAAERPAGRIIIDATKYFFSNRVISTWNNLPDIVINSPTLSTFKRHLSVLDLSCHS